MTSPTANASICRTCLSENGDMTSIFNTNQFETETSQISNIISICASIQIGEGDGLPEQMCTHCIVELKRAFAFRKLCEKSDTTLRQSLKQTVDEAEGTGNFDEGTNYDDDDEIAGLMDFTEYIVNVSDTDSNDDNNHTSNGNMYSGSKNMSNRQMPVLEMEVSDEERRKQKEVEPIRQYLCQRCDITFDTLYVYRMHKNAGNHKSKPNEDSERPVQKTQKSKPKKPIVTKVVEKNTPKAQHKPATCKICHMTFKKQMYLKQHEVVHKYVSSSTGQLDVAKPFECHECGRCMTNKGALVNHLKVHASDRPYQCGECKKTYVTKADLKKHSRVHTIGKPYACNKCDATYVYSTNLISHKRNAHK